jgi:hypothetical protein
MYKENGREKPADKQTVANTKSAATYVCENCGYAESVTKKVFGEVKVCSCGTQLVLKDNM